MSSKIVLKAYHRYLKGMCQEAAKQYTMYDFDLTEKELSAILASEEKNEVLKKDGEPV